MRWTFGDYVIAALLGVAGLCLIVALVGLGMEIMSRDDNPWRCELQVQTGTRTTPLMVGKVMTMQTRPVYECVLWSAPAEGGAGLVVSDGQRQILVTPTLEVR